MESPEPTSPASPEPTLLGLDEQCPLCGGDNGCRVAKGHLYKDVCWCQEIIVPGQILSRLAEEWVDPACLCRSCLETIARVSLELNSTDEILVEVRRLLSRPIEALTPDDYYYEPDGKMVFTAAYHLKRGACCANKCRHCPY
jgi:hypothetical protein